MGRLLIHVKSHRFEVQEAPGSRSFFTEIIASISDVKFAKDGRYMVSRDYMTLKVWISLLLHFWRLASFASYHVC